MTYDASCYYTNLIKNLDKNGTHLNIKHLVFKDLQITIKKFQDIIINCKQLSSLTLNNCRLFKKWLINLAPSSDDIVFITIIKPVFFEYKYKQPWYGKFIPEGFVPTEFGLEKSKEPFWIPEDSVKQIKQFIFIKTINTTPKKLLEKEFKGTTLNDKLRILIGQTHKILPNVITINIRLVYKDEKTKETFWVKEYKN